MFSLICIYHPIHCIFPSFLRFLSIFSGEPEASEHTMDPKYHKTVVNSDPGSQSRPFPPPPTPRFVPCTHCHNKPSALSCLIDSCRTATRNTPNNLNNSHDNTPGTTPITPTNDKTGTPTSIPWWSKSSAPVRRTPTP